MTDKKAKQEYVNRVAFPKTENDADDDENDTETTNVAVEIEIEVERDDWIPDGGWGWGVVAGAVIIHVYVGGYMKSSGVMYLKFKDNFKQSAVATAWIFSLYTTFLLMLGPIASALCHRFSCRTVVFWGTVLTVLGQILSAFAPNIEFLYFSYSIVGGFGRCLTYTPSLILVTQYFNKRRGLAVGISTAGVGLGMFSFPPLIEALFTHYGYQGAMIVLTGVCCQAFASAAFFRPLELHKKIVKTQKLNSLVKESRRGGVDARELLQSLNGRTEKSKTYADRMREKMKEAHMLSSSTEIAHIVPQQRKKSVFQEKLGQVKEVFKRNSDKERKPLFEISLLKDFPFFSLCLSMLFFTSSMMSTFVFLPPLAKVSGVSELQAAYLVSIIGVCDSVARFSSSFILDMKRMKRFRLLVYNGVMFGVGIVSMIMPSLHGFIAFAVAAGCYGALAGTYVAQKSVVVVDVLGVEKMTSSFGLLLGFQGIGSLIGPTISGLFRDVFGTFDEAFYFGAIGIFLGGVVLLCGNIWKIIRDGREKRAETHKENEE